MYTPKQNKPIYTLSTWHDHALHATRFQRTGDTVKATRSAKFAKAKLLQGKK